jgi:hypothetical protein
MKTTRLLQWGGLALAVVLFAAGLRQWRKPHQVSPPAPIASSTVAGPTSQTASEPPRAVENYAAFEKRPFPVAHEAGTLQWTSEDGKDPTVIRRLAHNDLEYQRMLEENARIIRRQLVYRKETAAALVQQARLSGRPVRWMTLPGLDGQEVPFEIETADLNPSGQQGTFAGHVAGRRDSMVTLAFKGGREAFTVISPSDNLYLQGDPREPGELVVKSFDPETYITGVCGNP